MRHGAGGVAPQGGAGSEQQGDGNGVQQEPSGNESQGTGGAGDGAQRLGSRSPARHRRLSRSPPPRRGRHGELVVRERVVRESGGSPNIRHSLAPTTSTGPW